MAIIGVNIKCNSFTYYIVSLITENDDMREIRIGQTSLFKNYPQISLR